MAARTLSSSSTSNTVSVPRGPRAGTAAGFPPAGRGAFAQMAERVAAGGMSAVAEVRTRTRTFSWEDPAATAGRGLTLPGLE